MTAYYNEIDPYCVEWLRNLIREGLIADGQVDDRSISDVTPNDLRGFTQCHFFAGLGGWPAALRSSGVWPDHRSVWTGSCPCQPFSVAGKGGGFADERHLWPAWHWLIEQCRPAVVLGEQVASASQWLGLVRGDLEALGYAVGAIPVEAASAGADHLRDRYWFVADDGRRRRDEPRGWQGEQPRRAETFRAGDLGDARGQGLAVGLLAVDQRGALRQEGPPAAAAGDRGGALANPFGLSVRDQPGWSGGAHGTGAGINRDDSEVDLANADECGWPPRNGAAQTARYGHTAPADGNGFEWVRGHDGKARRVKSGIRLLAYGVPQRVAKLRALGNAIDLRPAKAFIQAVSESL